MKLQSDSYGTEYRDRMKRSMSEPAKCSCLQCRGVISKMPITVVDPEPRMPLVQRVFGVLIGVCFLLVVGHEIVLRWVSR